MSWLPRLQRRLFDLNVLLLLLLFTLISARHIENHVDEEDWLEEYANRSALSRRRDRLWDAFAELRPALEEIPKQLRLLPIRLGFTPPGLQRNQDPIPQKKSFPCPLPKRNGLKPATSVHRLRPSDISVVAALGDSLTAANGALAYTEADTRNNYRGVSASGGGEATWRTYLTLPNILKEFNPNLVGYAKGTAEVDSPLAGFNLAENGVLDDSLIYQAQQLVKRIRKHPRIDFNHSWKLVSILTGNNDICNEYCWVKTSKDSGAGHEAALRSAILYLKRNLPRTLINLIQIPDITVMKDMENVPLICYAKQLVLCSCLFGGDERTKAADVAARILDYWQAEARVAADPEFQTETFAVVLQPFFTGVTLPPSARTIFGDATPDFSMFAPDCFHFSQRSHALAANALWNNMLEPNGNKSLGWTPGLLERFLCPSERAPYIFTGKNSRQFRISGHQ